MVRCYIRKRRIRSLELPKRKKNAGHIFPWRRFSLRIFSTPVWPSLNDFLQSYTWVFGSVSSPNYALSLFGISASFTSYLVRNLNSQRSHLFTHRNRYWQMHVDTQWYIIKVTENPSLTTCKLILFFAGICDWESPVYIWTNLMQTKKIWCGAL
jgi:hypothetical protein